VGKRGLSKRKGRRVWEKNGWVEGGRRMGEKGEREREREERRVYVNTVQAAYG
jgi:hypothetical protein